MTQEELTGVIAGEFVTVEASGGKSNKNVGESIFMWFQKFLVQFNNIHPGWFI